MGSGPSCLSSGSVHHSSAADEDAELVRVVRSTDGELFQYPGPVFVKDLMSGFQGFAVFNACNSKGSSLWEKPLHPDTELTFRKLYHLKPLLKPSIKQAAPGEPIKPISKKGYTSLPEEERSVQKPRVVEEKLKVKKVRFVDEAIIIPSSDDLIRSRKGCEVQNEEELSHVKNEGNKVIRASYVDELVQEEEVFCKEQRNCKVIKGVVRLKVVVSQKQLTELMSPKTTEKQADALLEKMMAPLQSSSTKYGNLSAQTWQRPSLEHINNPTCNPHHSRVSLS